MSDQYTPKKPQNVFVNNITSTSFVINWEGQPDLLSKDLSDPTDYEILITQNKDGKWTDYSMLTVTQYTKSYTFIGKDPNTNYRIIVRANNSYGSTDSEVITVKTLNNVPNCNIMANDGKMYYYNEDLLRDKLGVDITSSPLPYYIGIGICSFFILLFAFMLFTVDRTFGWTFKNWLLFCLLLLNMLLLAYILKHIIAYNDAVYASKELPPPPSESGRPCLTKDKELLD